jgi:hypothetical protein
MFIAIRNQYLTEVITSRKLQKLRNTTHVELIEEIVKQEYRLALSMACQQPIFGKLKRNKEGLLLSL